MTLAAHDFHELRIAGVRRETADAISVEFEVPQPLQEFFRFKPGQHLGLRMILDGQEQRRTYSICSGPDDARLRVAIKRVAGGLFSTWANTALAAGQTIDVMPPAGRFILPASEGRERHVLALAAGAGITPIIAMVKHALAKEPETRVTLIYGNRTAESTLFREELEDLKDRYLQRFSLLHVLSRNEEGDTPLLEGRITAEKIGMLTGRLLRLEDTAHAFLCGPGTMIKEARNALIALGLPRERVHHEFFAAVADAAEAAQAMGETGTQDTAVVALVDGVRRSFTVPPGVVVVDAALKAGIRVPYSCKGGMCCTCRARIVEGTAQMRTNYSLEPWEIERGFILTCQALPTSERLVLDYDQM
jgi:ring-1,2-phenylacetyl-CoA epoxidase subunit PaaE